MKLLNFYERFGFPILLVIFFYALLNLSVKWLIVLAVLVLLFWNVGVSILHKLEKMEKEITSSEEKKMKNDLENR